MRNAAPMMRSEAEAAFGCECVGGPLDGENRACQGKKDGAVMGERTLKGSDVHHLYRLQIRFFCTEWVYDGIVTNLKFQ